MSQIALKAKEKGRPGKRRPETLLTGCATWAGDDKLPTTATALNGFASRTNLQFDPFP